MVSIICFNPRAKVLKIFSLFGLITGVTYPFRALGIFFRHRKLLPYLIVPIIINLIVGIILYITLLFFGFDLIKDFVVIITVQIDKLVNKLPSWLAFLDYITIVLSWFLRLLLSVALLILNGFVMLQFGVIIGSPWYGQLSEKLEEIKLRQVTNIEVGIIQDISRAVLFELKKLLLAVGVGIGLFFLNFIPGIGTLIASIGGIALTATIVCLDFFDSSLERRRLSFRQKLRIVYFSLPASASFSLVALTLISVPLLNLITIPICVASGTLFVCDRVLPKLDTDSVITSTRN
jgi:CysZ protein